MTGAIGDATELIEALREAQRAAWGDSNDEEIDALRGALDVALEILGVEWPEEDDEE